MRHPTTPLPASRDRDGRPPALAALALVVATVALVVYAGAGWFVRYVADDYDRAASLHRLGWWGAQVQEFRGWSGRFTSEAATLTAMLPGPWVARVLPGCLLAAWVIALMWTLRRVAEVAAVDLRWWQALLVAEGVVLATISAAPDLFESIYWLTGSLTYCAPLILGTVLVGLVARASGRPRWRLVAVGALTAFIAGGCSDTYVCGQTAALALGLAMVWRHRASLRPMLASSLGGSLVALALVALAPGNAAREAYMPPHPSLISAFARATGETARIAVDAVAQHPLVLVVALLTASLTMGCPRLQRVRPGVVIAVGLGGLAVAVAMVVPAYWATSAAPPRRADLDPTYVVTLLMASLGCAAGLAMKVRGAEVGVSRLPSLVPAMLAVAVLGAVVPVLGSMPAVADYAQTKDAQAAAIAAGGRGAIEVPPVNAQAMGPLSYDNVEELTPAADYWVNQAEAVFYGARSIVAGARSAAR